MHEITVERIVKSVNRRVKAKAKAVMRMIWRKKSIFFVSLPKSGTVYTWNAVSNVTGLDVPDFHAMKGWHKYNSGQDFTCPKLYACGDYNTQMLLPNNMKHYAHGYFFGSHMQASYHNMKTLEQAGIDRIVVLLRDPRDALVSWVHHLRKLGNTTRDYHSKIYHIPRDYYDWAIEKQFDFQIRTFLPNVINWVESWLDYYASPDRKIDVLFVLYDELKRDPVSYVKKIVKFNQYQQADYSKVVIPEKGKMHFRKGEHDQWKSDFSEHNQQLANDLLQDRIPKAVEKAALSHPNIQLSELQLKNGDARDAAKLILEVIGQFPNSMGCYELFFRAVSSMGVDTSEVREMIITELESLPVEGYFIYRESLVEMCRKVIV